MNQTNDMGEKSGKGITLLIKPASGKCNMRCEYCFYADEIVHREIADYGIMNEETLYTIIDKALNAATQEVHFAFQGGEPTLMGLDFYKKLVNYQERNFRSGIRVTNSIQTNGYLLDDEWARFLSRHNFLTGISIDGTKKIHDRYRKDQLGNGTLMKVLQAADILKEHNAAFNVLTVVTSETADAVEPIYRFFTRRGFSYQQYIACLDPIGCEKGSQKYSLLPEQYGNFLCRLFDLWYQDIVHGRFIYIRQFENLVGMLKGIDPESCDMGGKCSEQWVIEANGDVYPCDFYVTDKWKLGNIMNDTFSEMNNRRHELRFIEESQKVPDQCRSCRWYALCRNGCKRNRMSEPEGPGRSSFCVSYKQFFEYAYDRLAGIAARS